MVQDSGRAAVTVTTTTISATRRLEIDAGHRLRRHESKCANAHGHRYAFEITVTGQRLDEVGRVIDFGKIKEVVGGWLDEEWDHGMLLEHGDPLVEFLRVEGQKVVELPVPPTAENLVAIVAERSQSLLSEYGLTVVFVRCYETPNCWADWARVYEVV